jgi:hypothetical protein
MPTGTAKPKAETYYSAREVLIMGATCEEFYLWFSAAPGVGRWVAHTGIGLREAISAVSPPKGAAEFRAKVKQVKGRRVGGVKTLYVEYVGEW